MATRRQRPGRAVEGDCSLEQIPANTPAPAERPVAKFGYGHPKGFGIVAALCEIDAEPGMTLSCGHVAEEIRDRSARPMNSAAEGRIPACILHCSIAQGEAVTQRMGKLSQPQQGFRSIKAARCVGDRALEQRPGARSIARR